MTRKATLPKITECIDPMPRVSSFTEVRLLQSLAAFVLIGSLALAHVHLQFLGTDMRLQQRELQKKVVELINEEQRLLRANEQFCSRQTLAARATQERMQEIDVRHQKVAIVTAELKKKYQLPARSASGPERGIAIISRSRKSVGEQVLSFFDVAKAQAAEK